MTARAIMLQGTGSDVGKTVLVAGLCRMATRRGLRVRPFKPQNMSNNAAVADEPMPDGSFGEIGRAQYLQAQACRTPSSVHMNPVLLKPQSETGSQIVVHGKVVGAAQGSDYQKLKSSLLGSVLESFRELSKNCDLVICEGAGSPAEVNLRRGDIANMGFATAADIPVVLVGDIDRGGVIASLVGTHAILDAADRRQISGFLINKFRGDVSLFDDGLRIVRDYTDWPSLGVVPWLDVVRHLPAEDSVMLSRTTSGARGVKIVVPVLSRIANFDDLDPLAAEPEVDLRFLHPGERLPDDADLIVLPGSKSTIADMAELERLGWAAAIRRYAASGGRVIGICGGFQMLGTSIRDPDGIEGERREIAGLALLDVETTLDVRKILRNATDRPGYEIHMGRTVGPDTRRPMVRIDGRGDGATSPNKRVQGCYLHGLFRSDAARCRYLSDLGATSRITSFDDHVDAALDELADRLEDVLDAEIFDLARRSDVASSIDSMPQVGSL